MDFIIPGNLPSHPVVVQLGFLVYSATKPEPCGSIIVPEQRRLRNSYLTDGMAEKSTNIATTRKTCNGCGGSGQISFFRGVSRFVMDWDDCPDCFGTGYIEMPAGKTAEKAEPPDQQKPHCTD